MKKVLSLILTCAVLFGAMSVFAGCTPRSEILKISNWEDYIDMDYLKDKEVGFKAYYKAKTGKNVKVKYNTFDTNEILYEEIKNQKADYDVVCPSDYMNERLQQEGLLKKVDKTIVYGDAAYSDVYVNAMLDILAPLNSTEHGDWLDYAIPYMWGTLGIFYNSKYVTGDNVALMSSWDCLFDQTKFGPAFGISENAKKFSMKDSERDAFAAANVYLNKTELAALSGQAYKDKLIDIVSDKDAIDSAITLLSEQKKYVKTYEVDKGKLDMVNNSDSMYYGLYWSCDAGYAMLENQNLYYAVPEEGSNVWIDGFVIPAYTKNEEAAQYFLKWLIDTEWGTPQAMFEYVGSSTPVKSVAEEYEEELSDMDNFKAFFENFSCENPEAFQANFLDMMFPKAETLERCAMMRYFGADASRKLADDFVSKVKP